MMKPILVVDCGSSKVPQIEAALRRESAVYTTVKLMELDILPDVSGIIISGAPILLTETEHTPFLEKAEIIFSNPGLPVLGICFGHQLMGLYHGATVSRCKEDRDWQEIYIIHDLPLVHKGMFSVVMMEDHCECISNPDHFKVKGYSAVCTNELMQHHSNPWFGAQFHPEASDEAGHSFIANFIALCTAKPA